MPTEVNQPSVGAKRLASHLPMLKALLNGTDAMRLAGKAYLPQWPGEEEAAYNTRLGSATLFPAYGRTVTVLAARPFSEPATLSDDANTRLKEEWWTDIDNEGSTFDQFAGRLLAEALGYGFAGILVDSPPIVAATGVGGQATKADEKASGVRPYFCLIRNEALLGWKYEMRAGEYIFTQLRYMECVLEADGKWGDEEVQQVRVVEPHKWTTYRKSKEEGKKDQWVKHKEGRTELDYVPFVPVYGRFQGFMKSEPPLLDLAHMNVEHWQSKSDQQTIMHFARVPILTCIGGDDKTKIVIGGSSAVVVPQGGDLKFTEHSGKSIEAGQKSLDALEMLMRQAGAELLVIRPGQVTATQVWSENEAGVCTLQRITINLEHSLNLALEYMADLAGEAKIGTVKLWKDFGVTNLTEASGELILKMNVAGKLSDETMFKEMQRRGIVDPERSFEDEQTALDEQGPPLGGLGQDDEYERDEKGNMVLDKVTGLPVKKKPPVPAPGTPPPPPPPPPAKE